MVQCNVMMLDTVYSRGQKLLCLITESQLRRTNEGITGLLASIFPLPLSLYSVVAMTIIISENCTPTKFVTTCQEKSNCISSTTEIQLGYSCSLGQKNVRRSSVKLSL